MASATIKERPENLTRVDTPAGRDLTGGGPAGNGPAEVAAWAEALRDSFEAKGKLLTVRGIVRAARSAGAMEAIPVIKEIYKVEYDDEVTADGGSPPERKPTPAKAEAEKPAAAPAKATNGKTTQAKAAKGAPVKKGGKPTPAKANPKKGNGKAPPPVKATKDKPERDGGRVPELTGAVVKVNNKTDVEVIVRRSERGTTKAMVFGKYPVRAILRHMGEQGWKYDEAESALKRMGLTAPNVWGKANLTSTIHNQLASGKNGEDGWAGPVPELTASEARAIKSLRNAD